MPFITKLTEPAAAVPVPYPAAADSLFTYPLTDKSDESEILAFLAERPVHNAVMSGYIRDNGLESPFNRGTFYACRDAARRLHGVALIGHAMFVEARSEAALRSFARLAQQEREAHMIMGEHETVEHFWDFYSGGGQPSRLFSREVLFTQNVPAAEFAPVPGLRPATLEDLPAIIPVHAALAYQESGVNPLDVDFKGFRMRCARRVEQGRVWVLVERDVLVFKADIIADTPDCIYIEGVYVAPQERGKGYGVGCLSELGRSLLARTKTISSLVNEENVAALELFRKAGYVAGGFYDTIFLQRKGGAPAGV